LTHIVVVIARCEMLTCIVVYTDAIFVYVLVSVYLLETCKYM